MSMGGDVGSMTTAQLEEARRRLEDETKSKRLVEHWNLWIQNGHLKYCLSL